MSTNSNVGQSVRKLREKSGLTQSQIAQFLGVDQSYVSKCESGERQFQMDLLEKLAHLFGCDTADLFRAEPPRETLSFAFRADSIEAEDLEAISEIHKIALNLREMRQLLEG